MPPRPAASASAPAHRRRVLSFIVLRCARYRPRIALMSAVIPVLIGRHLRSADKKLRVIYGRTLSAIVDAVELAGDAGASAGGSGPAALIVGSGNHAALARPTSTVGPIPTPGGPGCPGAGAAPGVAIAGAGHRARPRPPDISPGPRSPTPLAGPSGGFAPLPKGHGRSTSSAMTSP